MKQDTIIILDYGSQYTRLLSRRLREMNVFCDLVAPDIDKAFFDNRNIKGFILSGGPNSVFDVEAPKIPDWILNTKLPILGICYGMQLIAERLYGSVEKSDKREFGNSELIILIKDPLFSNVPKNNNVWMSHGDKIVELPKKFNVIANTSNSFCAAFNYENIWGVQFHPEEDNTDYGVNI